MEPLQTATDGYRPVADYSKPASNYNPAEQVIGNYQAPAELAMGAPIVRVKTMRLTDGRADHFVSIKVGDREVHPHVFREEFKAAYHVALYSWLLNGTAEPELMAFNEGEWPAQATELVGADPAQIERLQEEVARLQDDLDEARQVLWPEWSTKILKLVRSYSGYDGYDDATEGVDLVAEVEEALSELNTAAEAVAEKDQMHGMEINRLRTMVERAQQIISTSTYPNWHEAARVALSSPMGGGE